MAKVLEFQLQHHSLQRDPRADLLQNGLVGSPRSPRKGVKLSLINIEEKRVKNRQIILEMTEVKNLSLLIFMIFKSIEIQLYLVITRIVLKT